MITTRSMLPWTISWLVRFGFRAIASLCKIEVVEGAGRINELVDNGSPAVISFWHEHLFACTQVLRKQFIRRGHPVTILVSHSRDGEMAQRLATAWGAQIIRGSASRGGTEGLRGLYRAVTRDRSSVIMIPDGPHGPPHIAKPGAIALAQVSRAPILPMASAARSYRRIGSWDRMIVPNLLTRVVVCVGEPLSIAHDADSNELEREREHLEQVLADLAAKAKSYSSTS
jgi:lysophospholipid acyltransferase (LPLAT)-like uncharacterized protein